MGYYGCYYGYTYYGCYYGYTYYGTSSTKMCVTPGSSVSSSSRLAVSSK